MAIRVVRSVSGAAHIGVVLESEASNLRLQPVAIPAWRCLKARWDNMMKKGIAKKHL